MSKKPNPKREELKAISAPFKVLKASGAIDTINEGLVEMYEQQGHKNLKTIRQWNKEGRKVKKGEHALLVWGTPRERVIKKAIAEGKTEDEILNFFPVCYLFSENQIATP